MILSKAFLLFLFFIFVQFIINFSFRWSQKATKLDIFLSIYDKKTNQQCTSSGDWILFNHSNYFRKQSCYFFIDASIVIVHFIHLTKNKANFEYSLQNWGNRSQTLKIDKIKRISLPQDLFNGKYSLSRVLLWVNNKNDSINKNSEYVLTVEINNSSINLNLKNKLFKNDQIEKKNVLICTKLFFNNSNRIDEYRDWIKINKLFGVDHIQGYKFAGDYEGMFDSISLTSVNCIPNLFKSDDDLDNFRNNNDFFLNPPNILPFYIKMDLINVLLINECYLDNIEKYKFVLVVDSDEIVFPKLEKNLIENKQVLSEVPGFDLATFIQSLKWNHKSSFYLKQKTSLSFQLIEQMCSKLESLITFPQIFNVIEHNMKFKFKISSLKEFQYGIHLCDLYYKKIKIHNFKSSFGRFFFVSSKKLGKSVHSTDKALILRTHRILYDYSFSSVKPFSIKHSKTNFVIKKHLIHFRPTCKYLVLKTINVREIFFNQDYFDFFKEHINN